jgi:feruloyl-CoA synthase
MTPPRVLESKDILARLDVRGVSRPDGSIVLENTLPLSPYKPGAASAFLDWARRTPDSIALADRLGRMRSWRTLTYGALADRSARLGQALIDAGCSADRPVMLLSENRIEAAIAIVAAYRCGVAVAPVTPLYSSGAGNSGRLAAVMETLRPCLVIADDAGRHKDGLRRVGRDDLRIVTFSECAGHMTLDEFSTGPALASFQAAEAAIGESSVAKILFTSGSTGTPKGVITTHGMLASNIRSLRDAWPILDKSPPVIVDWLPWTHTFGGNFVFGSVLSTGGSLYIDDGRPAPATIDVSIRNACEIRPNIHLNVPRGLDLVARVLKADPSLAEAFFDRLQLVFFASAGLPSYVRDEWLKLIRQYAKQDVVFCSSWGTTETAPMATSLNFDAPEINNIGIPSPGCLVKLAPVDGRTELRVKGSGVTPGYLGRPDLTEKAFDEDGFFRTGDVGALADPSRPAAGILIQGRLAEDFKLASGTWVNVSGLRNQLLTALGAISRDVVLSGHNRDAIAVLIFLDFDHCRKFAKAQLSDEDIARHPAILAHIEAAIAAHNLANTGSSRGFAQFKIMTRALDPSAGELTEKGTVNQAAVLRRESEMLDALHAAGL